MLERSNPFTWPRAIFKTIVRTSHVPFKQNATVSVLPAGITPSGFAIISGNSSRLLKLVQSVWYENIFRFRQSSNKIWSFANHT